MGYSCNAVSMDTLNVIMDNQEKVIHNGIPMSNTWIYKGTKFFYEIGRENANGSITGTIWKHINDTQVIKGGSFKIDGSGKIIRFPYIKK